MPIWIRQDWCRDEFQFQGIKRFFAFLPFMGRFFSDVFSFRVFDVFAKLGINSLWHDANQREERSSFLVMWSLHSFSVNDDVCLSTKNLSIEDVSGKRKLYHKFYGPFKIIEKINNVSFWLELSEPMKARRIHDAFRCSLFKPYIPDKYGRFDQSLPPVNMQEGVEE